jgi:hypothetical protein
MPALQPSDDDFPRNPTFGPDPETFLVDPRDVRVEFLSDPYRNELRWIEFWDSRSGELLLQMSAIEHTDDRVVLINRGG